MTESEYNEAITKIDTAILSIIETGKRYTLELGTAGSQRIEVTRASIPELRSIRALYQQELRDLKAKRESGGGVFYAR